jgi:hypothetical protein
MSTNKTSYKISTNLSYKVLDVLRDEVIKNFIRRTDNTVDLMFLNLASNIRIAIGSRIND